MRRVRILIKTLLIALIPSILFFGLSSGLELSQRKLNKNIDFANVKAEDIFENLQLLGMEKEHLQMLNSKEASLYSDINAILKGEETLDINNGTVKITLYNIFFNGENYLDKIRILAFYQWIAPPASTGRACFKIVLPNNNFTVVKSSANNINFLNIIEKTIEGNSFLYNVGYKEFYPQILSMETGVINVFPFVGKQGGWLAFDVSLKNPSEENAYQIKTVFSLVYKGIFYSSPEKSANSRPSDWKYKANFEYAFDYKNIFSVD